MAVDDIMTFELITLLKLECPLPNRWAFLLNGYVKTVFKDLYVSLYEQCAVQRHTYAGHQS